MAHLPKTKVALCLCVVALLVVVSGCGSFKSMFKLQKDVSKEFGINVTKVSIYNRVHLQLRFDNADLRGKDLPTLAREIAEFTRDNYDGFNDLETVSVIFGSNNQCGPVGVSSTGSTFEFKTSELVETKDEEAQP